MQKKKNEKESIKEYKEEQRKEKKIGFTLEEGRGWAGRRVVGEGGLPVLG